MEVDGEDTVSRHQSKAEAVAAGYVEAVHLGALHVIHNKNGTVHERRRYEEGEQRVGR